jgi:hypothetical protein
MKKFFIILMAAALVVAFTLPATAATKIAISGGQVVRTMVTKTDQATGIRDTSPLTWEDKSDPSAKIRLKATVDDLVGFQADMKFQSAGARADDVYGYYNLGFGRLVVGMKLLPTFFCGFPGADVGDRVAGTGGDLRGAGLQLERMKFGPLDAAVALSEHTASTSGAFMYPKSQCRNLPVTSPIKVVRSA